MASTLPCPCSPLQIPIPPSEFTWPTSPASMRAEPSQRTSSNSCMVPKQRQLEPQRNLDEGVAEQTFHLIPISWLALDPSSKLSPPRFPFHLNPPFHFESLVFYLNCLSSHFKFYQPFISTLIQTSLYASDHINSASSFSRDRHAKSFLQC